MSIPKPYLYKKPSKRRPRFNVNRLTQIASVSDPVALTGFVNGVQASDLEERLARGLRKSDREFSFQISVPVEGSADEKLVDFIVRDGLIYPVEVYGYIGHHSSAQKGADEVREARLNETFMVMSMQPLQVAEYWELDSQELADRKAMEMF